MDSINRIYVVKIGPLLDVFPYFFDDDNVDLCICLVETNFKLHFVQRSPIHYSCFHDLLSKLFGPAVCYSNSLEIEIFVSLSF